MEGLSFSYFFWLPVHRTDHLLAYVGMFMKHMRGPDEELDEAYEQFFRMVRHEQNVVQHAILAGVGQLEESFENINTTLEDNRAATQQIAHDAETAVAETTRIHELLEGKAPAPPSLTDN